MKTRRTEIGKNFLHAIGRQIVGLKPGRGVDAIPTAGMGGTGSRDCDLSHWYSVKRCAYSLLKFVACFTIILYICTNIKRKVKLKSGSTINWWDWERMNGKTIHNGRSGVSGSPSLFALLRREKKVGESFFSSEILNATKALCWNVLSRRAILAWDISIISVR